MRPDFNNFRYTVFGSPDANRFQIFRQDLDDPDEMTRDFALENYVNSLPLDERMDEALRIHYGANFDNLRPAINNTLNDFTNLRRQN